MGENTEAQEAQEAPRPEWRWLGAPPDDNRLQCAFDVTYSKARTFADSDWDLGPVLLGAETADDRKHGAEREVTIESKGTDPFLFERLATAVLQRKAMTGYFLCDHTVNGRRYRIGIFVDAIPASFRPTADGASVVIEYTRRDEGSFLAIEDA